MRRWSWSIATAASADGQVFPAGPLRAPLAAQIARTDALVIVGRGTAADAVATDIAASGKPVLRRPAQAG